MFGSKMWVYTKLNKKTFKLLKKNLIYRKKKYKNFEYVFSKLRLCDIRKFLKVNKTALQSLHTVSATSISFSCFIWLESDLFIFKKIHIGNVWDEILWLALN